MTANHHKPPLTKAKTGRLPPGVANPVDIHVGARLRLARHMHNLSQEALGTSVGLTFQQIQKYERGTNRIGASRLFQFSEILNVSVSFFFDEMPAPITTREGAYKAGMKDQAQSPFGSDPMARRETLELVRAYYQIPDSQVRRNIYDLVKSLARSTSKTDDVDGS